MKRYAIGFDYGGTRLKCGVVSEQGELLKRDFLTFDSSATMDERTALIADYANTAMASTEGECTGIGLALTGVVDPKQGVVYLPGKIDGLEGYPMVEKLSAQCEGLKVVAVNDGNAALYAEKFFGQAKELSWAVVLTLGTGVGSGVLLNGMILDDPRFLFGVQVGHLVMDYKSPTLCITGARGTGEVNCSATALALAMRSHLQRGIPSTLSAQYAKDPSSIDFKAVTDAVREKDALACDAFNRWQEALATLLINAVHAYSPEAIILSGGATKASDLFLENVTEKMNQQIFRYPKGDAVPVLISEVQEHAGVLGAAAIVL